MNEEIALVKELKGDLYGEGEQPQDNVIDKFMRYALAKRFGRDIESVKENLKKDCQRPGIYNRATYSLPRGGQTVVGTTIRMAETMMRHWGNITTETFVIRKKDSTIITVQGWDYERNVGESRQFEMKHERYTKKGMVKLKNDNEIREAMEAQAARLRRACILALIPQWLQDEALCWCNEAAEEAEADGREERAIAENAKRVLKMIEAFGKLDIDAGEVSRMAGVKPGDEIGPQELNVLRRIFKAIQGGDKKKEDFLPETKTKEKKTMDDINLKEEPPAEKSKKGDSLLDDMPDWSEGGAV